MLLRFHVIAPLANRPIQFPLYSLDLCIQLHDIHKRPSFFQSSHLQPLYAIIEHSEAF